MTGAVPPGWYPERPGGRLRYWDGRAWTEQVAGAMPVPAPYPTVVPAVAQPVVQPELAPGTRLATPAIWVFALLPLVTTVSSIVVAPSAASTGLLSDANATLSLLAQPEYLIPTLVGWLVAAGMVLLAWADRRALLRAGVVRPFAWQWAFFVLLGAFGGLVYGIGRAVVLRRRVHRGLAPLWVQIAVVLVGWIVGLIAVIMVLQAVFGGPGLGVSVVVPNV